VLFQGQVRPDSVDAGIKEFYDGLRAGEVATTSAVNPDGWSAVIEAAFKAGQDALILAFSSGLSVTCHSVRIAAEELSEKYPESKFLVVDTLCASLGQGLLVYHAAAQKKAGKTIEEVRDWAEVNKFNLCHWFTVNDLMHLKRGGRVSTATALVGTMLSIKPVMHVDNEGHLTKVTTARGRKASLLALVDQMEKTVTDPANQVVFISHGDCLEDAQFVADEVTKRFGTQEFRFNYVGPDIGAHPGPGVVALFFLGKKSGRKLPLIFGIIAGILGILAVITNLGASFPFLTVGIPAIPSLYFDWFGGCIQAFIFCTLTTLFIKQAADG
jgi:DegV family protein with EDD domain